MYYIYIRRVQDKIGTYRVQISKEKVNECLKSTSLWTNFINFLFFKKQVTNIFPTMFYIFHESGVKPF